jgi:predicted enzyme related to lactoylglutathione lyase
MAGKVVHFEIPAKDTARARKFYSSLFGWKITDANVPGTEYWLVDNGSKEQGGGIQPARDGEKGVTVYFDVDDIEAAIKKVRELGGTCDEKLPVPGQGWFSGCTDTEGNPFSLWQADPTATMPETAGAGRATA